MLQRNDLIDILRRAEANEASSQAAAQTALATARRALADFDRVEEVAARLEVFKSNFAKAADHVATNWHNPPHSPDGSVLHHPTLHRARADLDQVRAELDIALSRFEESSAAAVAAMSAVA